MKKHYQPLVALAIVLVFGSMAYAPTMDYGLEHESVTSDAGTLEQNVAQMWDHLDAVVTQECQGTTNFDRNSPEEQMANSIVCAEVGRFFQQAKQRAHNADQDSARELGEIEEEATWGTDW